MTMQKTRLPDTFEDAVVKVMAELTADGCGQVIGKSASLIRQAADPDAEHQLNLKQGLQLDVAYVMATGKEPTILTAYRRQLSSVAAPKHEPCERTDRIATFAKEAGEGLSAYSLLKGEYVSHNDGAVALKELSELEDVIKLMKRDIETAMGIDPLKVVD
ncbi:hypothetical protein [Kiloniella majae]|uniref:hypothetical protein n=1 Tax=Kiloniella majae TaxID=1938558 RepID=UPI000A278E7A|nr:hypothetical protein [Kiloniella majae]